jgi:hypothetical protein
VGIGAALVVGFDAGDGFVEPGGGESHGELLGRRSDDCWQQEVWATAQKVVIKSQD